MKCSVASLSVVFSLVIALAPAPALAAPSSGEIEFNRDIRPIFSHNCLACHGADSASRKGDLRLDVREAALTAKAFVPGKPNESEILKRILSADPEEVMPPPASKKKLTPSQIDLLKRWIAEGAEYQAPWSFLAPVRPAPPAVKNEAWIKNPIDRFVLAKLESIGLTPAPEADRPTLARRLSLDMTGLPPKPEDVEAFVNDKSPDAYEKLVDKFQALPTWGEHRGRYWLDAARYADTHGIHFDNFREMWTYRDWVIGAFNRNMPFDQFTIVQLAGDLLPNRTVDQQIASGFNRCNITTNEGGVIAEEYLVHYTRDRTETVGRVWMGLSINCMTCHDHKFDQLTQREFYEMAAFFNNTTQGAMDGNIKDTPPIITVPGAGDRTRWDAIAGEVTEAKKKVEERKKLASADFDKWLESAKPETFAAMVPTEGLKLHLELAGGDGNNIAYQLDGKPQQAALSVAPVWDAGHLAAQALKISGPTVELPAAGDFEKDQPFTAAAWVKVAPNQTGSVVSRMDDQAKYRGWDLWLEGGKVGTHIIHEWEGDALKVVSKNPIPTGQWAHVLVTYDGGGKAAGVKVYVNGAVQQVNVAADKLKGSTHTEVPFKIGQRSTSSRINDALVQDVRLYGRVLLSIEIEKLVKGVKARQIVSKPADQRTPAEKKELFDWYLPTLDTSYQELATSLKKLEDEQVAIKARGTIAHVMQEKGEAPMAFILHRGEYDKRRDQVQAGTPKILPPFPSELPKNRLGLAQWMLRPEHPLTARVTVNRIWQELFGTGIVKTSEDFGLAGDLPVNQELLDWMAIEFREQGWDMKKFYKLLVTSAAYRQSALVTPAKLEKDPQNRLISRGPRFRMDAEMVRDYALASTGILSSKIGGPSVKPYQPDGVWEAVAMIGSNTRDYKRDSGENLYRRSMYIFWKRSAPPAQMDIFNAPNRETCTVRRERTNTPLQALATLNDPQYIEAARFLAQATLKQPAAETAARLDFVAQRIISRPLKAEESAVVEGVLKDLLAFYQGHVEDAKKLIATGESKPDASLDPAQLAAWTMVVNELLNLDEVLNK